MPYMSGTTSTPARKRDKQSYAIGRKAGGLSDNLGEPADLDVGADDHRDQQYRVE